MHKSNFEKLYIFPIVKNREFDEKIYPPIASLNDYISKYSHHPFHISRYSKIDNENNCFRVYIRYRKIIGE